MDVNSYPGTVRVTVKAGLPGIEADGLRYGGRLQMRVDGAENDSNPRLFLNVIIYNSYVLQPTSLREFALVASFPEQDKDDNPQLTPAFYTVH